MSKVDYKKTLKHVYSASAQEVSIVDVPAMQFISIQGMGDPNTSEAYIQAIQALYAVAYAVKFAIKKTGVDYGVMPLEGLWWVDDLDQLDFNNKDNWHWRMMVMQPVELPSLLFAETVQHVSQKKDLPALAKVEISSYKEGKAAQILHVGPYADEAPTIAKLHQAILEQGYTLREKHHEIYLKDPRKSAPDKLHTILRQPIA